jgi:hypothetical protein
MTQFHRLARDPALAVALAFAFACILAGWPSAGEARKAKPTPQQAPQSAPASEASQEADQKKQAAAAARQAYDAGLKAFANGKYQPAIDQLSAAVKGGGLSSAEMAKALYTRGSSYKKLNKPGLAISDLTSALWLKNGLSGNDRQTAAAERAEAYKMAGLQETGNASDRVVVDDPNSGPGSSSAGLSAAAVAQAAAAHSQQGSANASANVSSPSGVAPASSAPITRQDAESEAAKDAARARAAYGAVDAGGLQAAAAATVVRSAEQSGTPAQPASSSTFAVAPPAEASPGPSALSAAPATPAPATSSVSSSVSGFFSNLFGGGSPAPAPAPQPTAVTTASTSHVEPETSSWSSSTVVTEGRKQSGAAKKALNRHPQTAAIAPAAAPVRAAKAGGKYKVHIAALRSRAEAEALAQKLVAQHGADLGNHAPTVDEAVIGSMGTFYRVRIGGYASQDEPRGLCNKLRTSGLDCLIVTN